MLKFKNIKQSKFQLLKDSWPELESLISTYKFFVCGGSLRTLVDKNENQIDDIDLFFDSEESMVAVRSILNDDEEKYSVLFTCPENTLFSFRYESTQTKIQLICLRYGSIEEHLNSFDFDITRLGWDGEIVYVGSKATVKNIRRKYLSLNKLTYPSSTINRLIKYNEKGYSVKFVIKQIVEKLLTINGYRSEIYNSVNYLDSDIIDSETIYMD